VAGQSANLRGSISLQYALEKSNERSPEIATVVLNLLSINVDSPDKMHAVILSGLAKEQLSEKYPEVESVKSNVTAAHFFQKHPEAAKDYLDALAAALKRELT
jgi:hypothetical protein